LFLLPRLNRLTVRQETWIILFSLFSLCGIGLLVLTPPERFGMIIFSNTIIFVGFRILDIYAISLLNQFLPQEWRAGILAVSNLFNHCLSAIASQSVGYAFEFYSETINGVIAALLSAMLLLALFLRSYRKESLRSETQPPLPAEIPYGGTA